MRSRSTSTFLSQGLGQLSLVLILCVTQLRAVVVLWCQLHLICSNFHFFWIQMVEFAEDLLLGPGGGGRVGHELRIEEFGTLLVDKLIVEGHRLVVWILLLTFEAH